MADTIAVLFLIASSIVVTKTSPVSVIPTKDASYPLSTVFLPPNKVTVGSLFEYNSPLRYLHVFKVALCSATDVII